MTIKQAVQSVRRYGIRGVVDYFRRRGEARALQDFLAAHATEDRPSSGITVVGNLGSSFSLGKVLRDFASLLQETGVPFQALNIPCDNPVPESEYAHLLTPRDKFVTNRYSDIITMRQTFNIPDRRCRQSAIEFWEFEDGFKEAQPETIGMTNVIAMSDFDHDIFRRALPSVAVHKILYPFQFRHGDLTNARDTRRKYRIPETAFAAFFNFDFKSSYYRKNPEGILHAFAQAFPNGENAVLVFKTMRAKSCPAMNGQLHGLARDLGLTDRLITIDDFIPQEDLVNLTNACDVYISLHRGEGFGLGIAEAMTLGKPVIVTDYSSTTEFCKSEHALLVPYELVPVLPGQCDVDAYKHVTKWAEPDTHAAATALRKLYEDPEMRATIGLKGKAFIEDYFSPANFKRSIESFLCA